jgi:ribosomal protein L37AE/L43A
VSKVKLCLKCGKLSHYNTYFGAYMCDDCGYVERPRHYRVVSVCRFEKAEGQSLRENRKEEEKALVNS